RTVTAATERLLWTIAGTAALATLVCVVAIWRVGPKKAERGEPGPVLALELAKTPGDVTRLMDRENWPAAVRRSLLWDFGLITAYGTFFVAVGLGFAAHGARTLGALVIAAGVVAAVA